MNHSKKLILLAITQNPIIGRAKNQAGGMVFSKMYDKNVIRAKPLSVANPNTPAQQRQREFISELGQFAKQFGAEDLIQLFPNKPASRSRFSELQKQMAVGRDVSGSVGTIDWDDVHELGNGPSNVSGSPVVTKTAPEFDVDINPMNFSPTPPANALLTFIAVNTTKKQVVPFIDYTEWDEATLSFDYPSGWVQTDDIIVFVGVRTGTGTAGNDLGKTVK